jgi:hypothetical protein
MVKNYIMRNLMICTVHANIVQLIKIEKNVMGGALARMGEKRGVYRVLGGGLRKRDPLENPEVDGRIILI